MKFARVLALLTALVLLTCGCTRRDMDTPDASADMVPDVESKLEEGASRLEEGAEDLRSDVEEGAEDLRSDVEDGVSRIQDNMDDETEFPDDDDFPEKDRAPDDESVAAAAMSTDFAEIGALDGTLDNGFPGGERDEQNRPSGPLGYQEKYGKYDAHFIVPASEKIYLTFDEGYENGYTSRILDVLKEKNVKAVFFITYPYAKTEQELVSRMVEEGHVLGNHSTAHKTFPHMPLEEAAKDIMKLHDYVKTTYGYEMYLFRPPEGSFSEQTLALTQSLDYKTMLWSFAYNDWNPDKQPLTIEAADRIASRAHPGEICLLHAVSKTNAEILSDVIDRLRADGYEFANYFALEKTA